MKEQESLSLRPTKGEVWFGILLAVVGFIVFFVLGFQNPHINTLVLIWTIVTASCIGIFFRRRIEAHRIARDIEKDWSKERKVDH